MLHVLWEIFDCYEKYYTIRLITRTILETTIIWIEKILKFGVNYEQYIHKTKMFTSITF